MPIEPSFPRDQATLLRMLAKRAMIGGTPAFARAKTIVLFGSTGQVGTTTMCHNLACTMGLAGHRVAAIDLNPANRGLAQLAGRTPLVSVDDLVTNRLDLHEYLVPGLAASLLLPTDESLRAVPWPAASVDRFIDQLTGLGRHADILLIDAGCDLTPLTVELWRLARRFILVLNPTADSITAGYERIRTLHGRHRRERIQVLMNRANNPTGHTDLVAGIDSTARKFLNLSIEAAGHVEVATEIGAASKAAQPFVQRYADHTVSRSIQRLAEVLVREAFGASPNSDVNRAA